MSKEGPGAVEPADPMERAGQLTSDDFLRVKGTPFGLAPDPRGRALTVVGVEVVARSEGRCFSVFFSAPGPDVLPQRIYRLRHAELGELALFLVPIGIEPDAWPGAGPGAGSGAGSEAGGTIVRYEALFNRLPADRPPNATP